MNRQISLRMGQGLCVAGVLFLLLSGCTDMMQPVQGGGDGSGNANVDSLLEREESIGPYRVGDPYTVNGIRYVPQEDFSYNETGGASWYGGRFAGQRTANGERFDPAALTQRIDDVAAARAGEEEVHEARRHHAVHRERRRGRPGSALRWPRNAAQRVRVLRLVPPDGRRRMVFWVTCE